MSRGARGVVGIPRLARARGGRNERGIALIEILVELVIMGLIAGVLALLAAPPRFQCPGNDFEYDAGTGRLRLLIQDPARC